MAAPATTTTTTTTPSSAWSLRRTYNGLLDMARSVPAPDRMPSDNQAAYTTDFWQMWNGMEEVKQLIVDGAHSDRAASLPQALYQTCTLIVGLLRAAFVATRDHGVGHLLRSIETLSLSARGAGAAGTAPGEYVPPPDVSEEIWQERLPKRANAKHECEPASRCAHYQCAVCQEAQHDLRSYDRCGHCVCDACAEQIVRRPRLSCPQCRTASDRLVPLQLPDIVFVGV
jgi:hypothetical protein